MELDICVEDYEDIPDELGPGVPKTPYIAIEDIDGEIVEKGYTEEGGCIGFELKKGNYGIYASSLTEQGYREIDLEEDKEVTIGTKFRGILGNIGNC